MTQSSIKKRHQEAVEPLKAMLPILLISIAMGILCYLVCAFNFSDFERWVLYRHYRIRAFFMNYDEPFNPAIAIVGVDEETLNKDRLPLIYWNKRFEPVIKMMIKNGVKVVGLDFIQYLTMTDALQVIIDKECKARITSDLMSTLSEIPGINKAVISEWVDTLPSKMPIAEKDREMAVQLLSKKIILSAHINTDGLLTKPVDIMTLAAGWDNLGIVDVGAFKDETVIFQYLIFKAKGLSSTDKNDIVLNSFAASIVSAFSGAKFTFENGQKVALKNGKSIPLDEGGRLWINFRRPVFPGRDLRTLYSYGTVLKEAENGNDEYFKTNFGGRIVLIGLTGLTLDRFRTPFTSSDLKGNFESVSSNGEKVYSEYKMPGVELHGHIISTILDNNYLIIARWPINLFIVLLISLLTGCITYIARPYRALLKCIILGVLYFAAVVSCFIYFNTWIYFFTPILTLVCTFSAVYLYKFITEEQERQRIRKLMGRYVSTNVMEALLSNPSQLALGGTRKKVTILFSDINNFTPTSERLTAEELMRCLNSYFDEMNAIILKYNGTIKQFVGDEIMVMYGAPLEQDDQALRAVNTALEMVDKLNELKSRNPSGTPGFFEVKIGIHTGEVVVGNVGSHDRTEYAAVGDNVNLTSRIEGLNKKLGTKVLISEDTWREVKDSLVNAEFRSFEPQEVKGKTQRLTVYEVRRPERGGPNE